MSILFQAGSELSISEERLQLLLPRDLKSSAQRRAKRIGVSLGDNSIPGFGGTLLIDLGQVATIGQFQVSGGSGSIVFSMPPAGSVRFSQCAMPDATMPADQMSQRRSIGSPRTCSGAM